ncbi:hypothetical protein ABTX81_22790 [Kitasatospora sp. NPDC097605]|uniref:hypothetical protein n=1 Tax=Kitasatospora sp. NPDC097605 TaxID=3157226 RepID=UPI0033242B47
MTGDTTLIVPVTVNALAVNDQVRGEPFHRVPPDFSALAAHPPRLRQDPLHNLPNYDTGWSDDPRGNGVYVQWDLPHALSRARAEPGTGFTHPLVPDRWLVVRCHRPRTTTGTPVPTVAGWLVESDHVHDKPTGNPPQGSPFVLDGKPVRIGAARPLGTAGWLPADTGRPRFLTADGCGIPDFHLFQSFNQDVLSLHDPLTDATGAATLADGYVSYLVAGWYSHAEDDPLTATGQGTGPLDALLAFHGYRGAGLAAKDKARIGLDLLGWQASADHTPERSLYTGTVLGLDWHTTGGAWPSGKPVNAAGTVRVALGTNTADARDALREHDGLPHDERLLRRAFDGGRLTVLDHVLDDQARALNEAERDTCFTAVPAGCHWAVTATPVPDGKGGVTPPPALTADQATALDRLNTDQRDHDQTARELADVQRRLYELWWLAGLPSGKNADARACPSDRRKDLDHQLDRTAADSLAAKAAALLDRLATLRAKLPTGATTAQLTAAVKQTATALKLADGQRLGRVVHPPYHRAQDPVVLIEGAGSGPDLAPRAKVPCRRQEQLIDRITAQEGSLPAAPPGLAAQAWQPVIAAVPWAPLTQVLREFNALDQAADEARRAPAKPPEPDVRSWAEAHHHQAHAAGTGAPSWPDTTLWTQPWQPLFLLWDAAVHTLPVGPDNAEGWHFDGHHWHVDGRGKPEDHDLGGTTLHNLPGRALLVALPGFLVRGRIHDHLRRHPDAEADDLHTLDDKTTASQICQSLDGLGAYLAQRRTVSTYDPTDALVDLTAPVRAVPGPAPQPWGQGAAGAQFRLASLVVVDRFGRAYDHIDHEQDAAAADLARSTDLTPNTAHPAGHLPRPGDHTGTTLLYEDGDPATFAQLQPRIHQAARALIELVSPADDHLVLSTEAASTPKGTPDHGPVCGWIVPDHHRDILTVYAADGTGLGELLVTGPDDDRRLDWCPLPGSSVLETADLLTDAFTAQHPHLGDLLRGLADRDREGAVAAYTALRQVIDDGLKAIATPDDSHTTPWALVSGRPLAVVRARLRVELADAPHPRPTWDRLLAGPDPADGNPLRTTVWPFRLGDASRPSDGLIGYCTAPPGTPTGYIHLYSPYADQTPSKKGDRDRDTPYTRPVTPSAFPVAGADNTPYGDRPASGAAAWVTMLVDPFTRLHAATGVLPTAATRVPESALRGPLARIALCVPTGPVLATLARTGAGSGTDTGQPVGAPALALPSPGSWHGTWTWWERAEPGGGAQPWKHLEIGHTDTLVHPPDTVPDARTGYLTLTRPTAAQDDR